MPHLSAALLLLLPVVFGSTSPATQPPLRRVALTFGRRAVVLPLPFALLTSPAALLGPQRASAATVCSCPAGPDSCVCMERELKADKKRADAAGRDAADSKRDVAQMRQEIAAFEEAEARKAKGLGAPKAGAIKQDNRNVMDIKQERAAAVKKRSADEPASTQDMPVSPEFLGLSGGSSQNYGDVNKNDAEARFMKIVFDTAKKREYDYGFEIDDEDIQQIEEVLRPKYCGPQGLIGPCSAAVAKEKKRK